MIALNDTCDCCGAVRGSTGLFEWVEGTYICRHCLEALYASINARRAKPVMIEAADGSLYFPISYPPPNAHIVKVLLLGGKVTAGFINYSDMWVIVSEELGMTFSKDVIGWSEL